MSQWHCFRSMSLFAWLNSSHCFMFCFSLLVTWNWSHWQHRIPGYHFSRFFLPLMPWESFKLFSENLNGLDCLCSLSKLNPRGSHQGKSTEFYQLPLSSPYVPKEKRETWTGMREMGPNFSLQHPDSTSEAANKVTRDNRLGDSF